MQRLRLTALLLLAATLSAQPARGPGPVYLHFNGIDQYVDIPSSADFSVTHSGLTVSAWMRPDTLSFPNAEGSGYVYWMGKGSRGQQEWVFRMYNRSNTENPPRPNRISFYVFNPDGGLGVGSYFQDPVKPREWIQVTGVVDSERTYIYKDGELQRCDQYQGTPSGGCHGHPEVIHPERGGAPLRLGTRDLHSYFQGGLAGIRIWDRPLTAAEVRTLYEKGEAPRKGLAAEFLLNEGKGSVAHDSVHGHDGRIVGAEWAGR
jgi:concanavalin A-like lectin/glucanase superfamily protein